MPNTFYTESKLKSYFNCFQSDKNNDTQINIEINNFYEKSFKSERNLKTSKILDYYSSFLFDEKNFISDNVLIVNSLNHNFQNFIENGFVIADKMAIKFINQYYNFSIRKEHICYIDDIKSGKILNNIINKVSKGSYSHLFTVGGGKTIDFAKFISYKINIKQITIPSSLATHVYASPKIHALSPIKELGFKNTIDGESSHLSLIDITLLNKLYNTNSRLILSGFGDLMAFINSRHDWIQSSKNGNEIYSVFVDKSIDFIISKLESLDIKKSLKKWIEDYVFIQCLLCNITHWVGSAPASGAEHLFAKCIEDEVLQPPLHGELVAIGVLIFSYIRNKDVDKVLYLMKKFSISNSLSNLNLNKNVIIHALDKSLNEGNRKKRYTILNDLSLSNSFFNKIINSMIKQKLLEE